LERIRIGLHVGDVQLCVYPPFFPPFKTSGFPFFPPQEESECFLEDGLATSPLPKGAFFSSASSADVREPLSTDSTPPLEITLLLHLQGKISCPLFFFSLNPFPLYPLLPRSTFPALLHHCALTFLRSLPSFLQNDRPCRLIDFPFRGERGTSSLETNPALPSLDLKESPSSKCALPYPCVVVKTFFPVSH